MEGVRLPAQAIATTEGGSKVLIQQQVLRSHGARVEETKATYIFQNSETQTKKLIVPKVYWDEYYQPAKASRELLAILSVQEIVHILGKISIRQGDILKTSGKKKSRKQYQDDLIKNCESAEPVFRHADNKSIKAYLASKGYKGFSGSSHDDLRLIALSLACHLFKQEVKGKLVAAGQTPIKTFCQKCIDHKHSPKKCKITQGWLRMGLPMSNVVPEPNPDNSMIIKSVNRQEIASGNTLTAHNPRVLNARQKRALRRADPTKNATYCLLRQDELRLFHWQISRSPRCMRVFQSYIETKALKGLPDDLREIAKNVDLVSLESKTPFPYKPVEHSPSARCVPRLLLREAHFIAQKHITKVGDIDKIEFKPPLREKQMAQLSWINYSIYDPEIQGELEEQWTDNGEIEVPKKDTESSSYKPERGISREKQASLGSAKPLNENSEESNFHTQDNFNDRKVAREMELLTKHPKMKEWIQIMVSKGEKSLSPNSRNEGESEAYWHAYNDLQGIRKESQFLTGNDLKNWNELQALLHEEIADAVSLAKRFPCDHLRVEELTSLFTELLASEQVEVQKRFINSVTNGARKKNGETQLKEEGEGQSRTCRGSEAA